MQKVTKQRKYYFEQNIFSEIDTAEKAYWLGFLYADGYICSERKVFGIALKEEDKGHLIKFCDFLKINTYECIKYNKNTKSYRVQLNDVNIYLDLKRLGFTSKKSYDNDDSIFYKMPEEFKKFFILGIIDGDGYVFISDGAQKNLVGIVSNNEKLLESIAKFLCNVFNDKNFVKVTNYDYPRIRLARVKAYKVMKFLYKDTPVFLERKFSNFKNFSLPDKKYNKPYKYIRKLLSNRYFIKTPSINKKQYTIGTFDTIEEAINAFNIKAKEYGFKEQEYIGEFLDWSE